MLASGSSRVSIRIRDYRHHCYVGFGLGFRRSSKSVYSFTVKPPSATRNGEVPHQLLQQRTLASSSSSSSSGLESKFPGENPVGSNVFSQREGYHEASSEGSFSVAGGIVALGKFDALHIGHRELAIQASKAGVPFLLSFVGMAEVFGWEPRAPIVSQCDRKRVLSSWSLSCGNLVPREFQIEFSSVRHLSPRQFVEKLSKDLGVRGVVAGENYRFGYKASGDASDLVKLCQEYGIEAYVVKSVMDKNQELSNINACDLKERGQVSSTRVRHALAMGDMKYVSELLGRRHRILLAVNDQNVFSSCNGNTSLSAPKSWLLNLSPKDGLYENCALLFGDENLGAKCRVSIDETNIRLDIDGSGVFDYLNSQDVRLLGIEFGDRTE